MHRVEIFADGQDARVTHIDDETVPVPIRLATGMHAVALHFDDGDVTVAEIPMNGTRA